MGLLDGTAWEDEFGWDDSDIEELNLQHEEEAEYFGLMEAYSTVTANISYYTEDQLHNLLDLINRRLEKDS